MIACYFCDEPCDEERDEWSDAADCWLHRRCLAWQLNHREGYDATLHAIAREFGMQRAAPGRRALECPNGHAYTEANTRVNSRGSQICLVCNRRRWRAYSQRREKRGLQPRPLDRHAVTIMVSPAFQERLEHAAAGTPISRFVRETLLRELPKWEEKLKGQVKA